MLALLRRDHSPDIGSGENDERDESEHMPLQIGFYQASLECQWVIILWLRSYNSDREQSAERKIWAHFP